MDNKAGRVKDLLWLIAAAALSLGGIAAFVWLFALQINIYYFILSPVIIALYQAPAVLVFWIWKKKRGLRTQGRLSGRIQDEDDPRGKGKPEASAGRHDPPREE
ncbi:MAG TPA: hypothetical protein PLX50_04420 [Candidatus Aminicenantes bacterium]|nr:hypothetical protein [Acidobacteriota bacterium]HOI44837.1 hypothetical protein [Candidatus Aminicenantes bacterium]